MRPPILCLVTDRRRLLVPPDPAGAARLAALLERLGWACAAGVDLVQIREPDLPGRRLEELVARAVALAAGTPTRIVVSGRVDVALAAGAAGTHLPADGPDTARVRAIAPPGFLLGRSVHSAEEAAAWEARGGLDYLIFGTVCPTPSKPGLRRVAGIGGLARAVASCGLPVLAIGGVAIETIPDLARAGAAGFAAIGLFAAARSERDFASAVASARRLFDTSRPIP
jgi:thiamine-phosphate pyrophosphorylase